MTRMSRFLSIKALPLTVFLLLVGIWPLSQLPLLRVDNSIDVWLDHRSQEYRDYVEFTREYGRDEWILVAFSIRNVPWEKALSDLKTITAHVRQIEDGVNALSIADTGNPAVAVLRPILLSEDKKTAGIFIHLPAMVELDPPTLIARIEKVLTSYRDAYSFHLGGPLRNIVKTWGGATVRIARVTRPRTANDPTILSASHRSRRVDPNATTYACTQTDAGTDIVLIRK